MENREIGIRLKFLRKSCNITQKQLTSYLNISQGQMARLEGGHRKLKPEIIEKVCTLFNVDEDWLLFGEGECNCRTFRSNNPKKLNLEDISNMNKIINNIEFLAEVTEGLQ